MTTIVYNATTAVVAFDSGREIYMGWQPDLGFSYIELNFDTATNSGTRKPDATSATVALTAPQVDNVNTFLGIAESAMPIEGSAHYTWVLEGEWERAYSIAETKRQAIKALNDMADRVRYKYSTNIPPIGDLFVVLWDQIKTYLASGGTIPSYLQAELDARGLDSTHATTVANDIKNMYNTWHDATGSQIEKVRRTAILALNTANTRSGIKTVVDTARTSFEAL